MNPSPCPVQDPESPPDFIFDGADNPTFDLESMPTLCRDWDLADDRCLWHAVEELLVAFRARATAVVVERGVKKLIDDLSAVNDAKNVEVRVWQCCATARRPVVAAQCLCCVRPKCHRCQRKWRAAPLL